MGGGETGGSAPGDQDIKRFHTVVYGVVGILGTDASLLAAQISSNTELVYGSWDSEPVSQDGASPYDPALEPHELA